jgi:hypothetical protein
MFNNQSTGRTGRSITAAALFILSAGCASVAPMASRSATVAPLSSAPAPSASGLLSRAFRAAFVTRVQGDQSVGSSSLLGNTVNEVVPIPGTDMIKVGAVQEGSLFQSNFHNPTEDAKSRGGSTPTGATIVFRVSRP